LLYAYNDSKNFEINLSNYSGPLDVLLDLAKSQKVNLANISITQLADQFIEFINSAKKINLDLASEYLLMATWLTYLKSKLLLPQKFGSHVTFNVEKLEIKTIYINGPLKDLKTDWQFNPISRSKTIVNFSVDFEFKRFLHQKFAEIFYLLIENKLNNQEKYFGRTKHMIPVIFKADNCRLGELANIKITSFNQKNLFGIYNTNKMKAA